MTANIPKLRLLVGGTVIEGQQVGLELSQNDTFWLSETPEQVASEIAAF